MQDAGGCNQEHFRSSALQGADQKISVCEGSNSFTGKDTAAPKWAAGLPRIGCWCFWGIRPGYCLALAIQGGNPWTPGRKWTQKEGHALACPFSFYEKSRAGTQVDKMFHLQKIRYICYI